MRRKIKLPDFPEFKDVYEYESVWCFHEFNDYFYMYVSQDGFVMYGYIAPIGVDHDNAIVNSDRIEMEHNFQKRNRERAYNKIIKQLRQRYEEWVNSLFIDEGDE